MIAIKISQNVSDDAKLSMQDTFKCDSNNYNHNL